MRHLLAFLTTLGLAPTASPAPPSMAGFQAMDTDRDGKVSRDEHAAAAKRMFVAMDASRNGVVTAAEMDAAQERVTGQTPKKGDLTAAEKIKVIDTNGDGALTADEHASGSRSMFDTMDTDKDGALTEAEMSAGHAKLLQKPAK